MFVGGGQDTSAELLLVEDDDTDAERIERWVRNTPECAFDVLRARTLAQAVDLLEHHEPVVALVDLSLPDAHHMDSVVAVLESSPDCAVIVQTGEDEPTSPMEALELGAQDYLMKGTLTREILGRSIRYSVMRKHTERSLDRTQSELAQSDADLDDFANVVAHDLRAPVRTARLLADRLLAGIPTCDERTTDLGERLDDALERVDSMILSMLDYSALRGEMPDPEAVSLAAIAHEARNALEADVVAVAGRIDVDIAADLTVMGREDLLCRVLENLLANSVKYRRPDIPVRVLIAAHLDGQRIRLTITDNGIGVPSGSTNRVFQILERLESEKAGLGFGLAICRRIVSGLGGSIRIEAMDDPGTRVVVELDRVR